MKLKRILCALLAVALMLALCACYNPDTVATYGEDKKLSAGQYLLYQYYAAKDTIDKQKASSLAELLKTEIDGQPAEQYIQKLALEYAARDIVIEKEFERLGLEMDVLTEYQVQYYSQYYWNNGASSSLEKNGISYSTYAAMAMLEQKSTMVFSKYYGEGGEYEVPVSELMEYYNSHYSAVKMITFPLKQQDGSDLTAEQIAVATEAAQTIADAVNGGMSFTDALVAYYTPVQEALGYTGGDLLTAETAESKLTAVTMYEGLSGYSAEHIKAALSTEIGKANTFTVGGTNYVFVREAAFTDAESFSSLRTTALQALKSDEYLELLSKMAGEQVSFEVDQKAVDYYSVKKIKGL